jgi:hypothetical protein
MTGISSLHLFNGFLVLMVVLAAVVFYSLRYTPAGYGQYISKRWGKTIDNKAGWVIMEIPVVVVFAILGPHHPQPAKSGRHEVPHSAGRHVPVRHVRELLG